MGNGETKGTGVTKLRHFPGNPRTAAQASAFAIAFAAIRRLGCDSPAAEMASSPPLLRFFVESYIVPFSPLVVAAPSSSPRFGCLYVLDSPSCAPRRLVLPRSAVWRNDSRELFAVTPSPNRAVCVVWTLGQRAVGVWDTRTCGTPIDAFRLPFAGDDAKMRRIAACDGTWLAIPSRSRDGVAIVELWSMEASHALVANVSLGNPCSLRFNELPDCAFVKGIFELSAVSVNRLEESYQTLVALQINGDKTVEGNHYLTTRELRRTETAAKDGSTASTWEAELGYHAEYGHFERVAQWFCSPHRTGDSDFNVKAEQFPGDGHLVLVEFLSGFEVVSDSTLVTMWIVDKSDGCRAVTPASESTFASWAKGSAVVRLWYELCFAGPVAELAFKSPVVSVKANGGVLFVLEATGHVTAVDAHSGVVLWEIDTAWTSTSSSDENAKWL